MIGFHKFPKIDLHLHLDGSFSLETVWELAQEKGIAMPVQSLEEYRLWINRNANCGSVNQYLQLFDLPLQVMQDAQSLTRITQELIERLSSQNLAYAEIRFAPQLHTKSGLTQKGAVEAVLAGRKQALAHCPNIQIGILLCMMCVGSEKVNWEANAETVENAKAFLGRGVVGIDLAGAEGIVPLKNFAPLFRHASELGIPFTCHAGDSQGPDTVRDAMDFGAKRIGHGHHIFLDPGLCRRAAEEKIALEICPTSNVQCRTQPSYVRHPAKALMDMGIPVTINTDNMTLAGVSLESEYQHCMQEMGFSERDLVCANLNAAHAAFLPEQDRQRLIKELDAFL